MQTRKRMMVKSVNYEWNDDDDEFDNDYGSKRIELSHTHTHTHTQKSMYSFQYKCILSYSLSVVNVENYYFICSKQIADSSSQQFNRIGPNLGQYNFAKLAAIFFFDPFLFGICFWV